MSFHILNHRQIILIEYTEDDKKIYFYNITQTFEGGSWKFVCGILLSPFSDTPLPFTVAFIISALISSGPMFLDSKIALNCAFSSYK